MKRLLLLAAATIVVGTAATAQQLDVTTVAPIIEVPVTNRPLPPIVTRPTMRIQEERDFVFNSQIIERSAINDEGFRVDTNRNDFEIPFAYSIQGGGQAIQRGLGQILPMKYLFTFYDQYYSPGSKTKRYGDTNVITDDQVYIEQFKGARGWTLNAVRALVYHNPNNTTPADNLNPGAISLHKMNIDYNSTSYRNNGFRALRSTLDDPSVKIFEAEVDGQTLKSTVSSQGGIQGLTIEFDQPFEFGSDESALLMYVNDNADPISTIAANDPKEFQGFIAYEEWRTGILTTDPNTNQTVDTRKDSIGLFRTFGVAMFTENDTDRVYSVYSRLSRNNKPSLVNFDVTWVGTVDLSTTGVQFVLGKDATSQGLGETAPNPVVSDDARLPYSLTEKAHVSIDLYNMSGDHIARLVDDKFIPGNYTVALPLDKMNNGAYVVRMLANGKAYSSKLSVAR